MYHLSELLEQRVIEYFKQKHGLEISPATAMEKSSKSPKSRKKSTKTKYGYTLRDEGVMYTALGDPIIFEGQGRYVCGEGEIRTPEALAGLPLFESGAFNHSATSPSLKLNHDTTDLSFCPIVSRIFLKSEVKSQSKASLIVSQAISPPSFKLIFSP